ncbi:glycosyltransferase family 61 protein [Halobaculum sp. P14]|uniref:glycosyltransferase family 61 protein n=1 Tax=Halobaculum sp. P14 TaxID=3421638 RepID=UPI003EB949F3
MQELAGRILRRVGGSSAVRAALGRRTVDREDLGRATADGAADADWTMRWTGDPQTLTYSEPATPAPYPEKIDRRTSESFRLPAPFLAEFTDAHLVGRRGLTMAADGRYVTEASALGNTELLVQNLAVTVADGHAPVRRTPRRRLDCAVSLAGSWNFGYFHWTTDWLARLDAVRRYEADSGAEPSVLLPPDVTPWMLQSLDAAGVPEERRVHWSGERIGVDRLLVPSVRRVVHDDEPRDVDVLDPDALDWLRATMRANTADVDPPDDVTSRIYVSRADADARRVRNESALMDALSKYGFTRVVPSRLTVPEQVATFRDADVVVGPHGAGLTNALYADDATLLEFFGDRVATCYLTLTENLPVTYGLLEADPRGTDMVVSPTAVVDALASMGVDP